MAATPTSGERHRCRICAGSVRECLDLGSQPVSNTYPKNVSESAVPRFRLAIGVCTTCAMVQQTEQVPAQSMYGAEYPFRTSTSALMSDHFHTTARDIVSKLSGISDPFFVEIGCNDGTLLGRVAGAGIRHLGVDPAGDAAETAVRGGARVMVDYFGETSAKAVRARHGTADVVYSANTISHIGAIDEVFRGLDVLLSRDGAFVVEDRYLADIIEGTYFDQIYDEHIYLFSVRSVSNLASLFGFEVVDAERLGTHGGSMRYTISRRGGRAASPAVAAALALEDRRGLDDPDTYVRFGQRVENTRAELVGLLRDLRTRGASVVGYGATSKSATVLNYCGIGPDLLPFVCDSTPGKQGRLTPGSWIPIRPPEAFVPYPDYALLFAWNHAEEIMSKERAFSEGGGHWITYVPEVRVTSPSR
ncbi:class I SAM-dependent methyltransferase [Nocardiopsis sp. B62]|uniref:class I SAM-dependent methyltransferase n=1 Tax=Nocardiopsis sp. B62 TaxID=2824874 RepID=UPI001B364D4E|nr:class I SAM-dependent methyltransferase [Nocardiopsis sp. B62]MBQ1080608.1 methyltransferase domain-containing protein [Nocardiopsis sp. B62]